MSLDSAALPRASVLAVLVLWAGVSSADAPAASGAAPSASPPRAAASTAPGAPPLGPPEPGSGSRVKDEPCSESVKAWAARASGRTGLAVSAASCPAGVVRLAVQGAGCDFEVSRLRGFKRTPDGTFGVSPIVQLEWETAPAPMKKALDSILAALGADGTLEIPSGEPVFRTAPAAPGARAPKLALAAAATLVVVGALALWLRRRSAARRPASSG